MKALIELGRCLLIGLFALQLQASPATPTPRHCLGSAPQYAPAQNNVSLYTAIDVSNGNEATEYLYLNRNNSIVFQDSNGQILISQLGTSSPSTPKPLPKTRGILSRVVDSNERFILTHSPTYLLDLQSPTAWKAVLLQPNTTPLMWTKTHLILSRHEFGADGKPTLQLLKYCPVSGDLIRLCRPIDLSPAGYRLGTTDSTTSLALYQVDRGSAYGVHRLRVSELDLSTCQLEEKIRYAELFKDEPVRLHWFGNSKRVVALLDNPKNNVFVDDLSGRCQHVSLPAEEVSVPNPQVPWLFVWAERAGLRIYDVPKNNYRAMIDESDRYSSVSGGDIWVNPLGTTVLVNATKSNSRTLLRVNLNP